jgi:type I restriction enzyme S subunit
MAKNKKTMEELLEEALVQEEEQPYEVPENWKWVRLEKLTTKITDGAHKTPTYTSEGIPFISVKDIRNGVISFDDTRFVSQDTHIELIKRCKPELGDILVTKSGTIGRLAVVNTTKEFSLFVSVALIKPVKEVIDSKYLELFLTLSINQIAGKKYIKGSSIQNLHLTEIKKIEIPLIPLDEQKRIADKVERLLSKIDEAKQLIEEAKESFEIRRAAILDKAFRGEFNKSGQEIDLKELDGMNCFIPNNWNWMSLEDVCELISDCPHSTPKYIEDGQYPAIRTSDVHFGRIDISEARRVSEKDYIERTRRTQPQKGDIIYCREGTVGNAGIIEDEIVCLAQRVVLFRPNKVKVLPKYFVYVLNSPIMLRQVFSNISQTTSPRINISTLRKLSLPIAPIEIQQNIVNTIEKNLEIEQRANNLYKLEGNLNALKQSILSKAFQGELGTNNPSEESAVELLKEVLQEQVQ